MSPTAPVVPPRGKTALSPDQVDEIDRLRLRIVFRIQMINILFLENALEGHLALTHPFVEDCTVAEAMQELLEDMRQAATGIGALVKAGHEATA